MNRLSGWKFHCNTNHSIDAFLLCVYYLACLWGSHYHWGDQLNHPIKIQLWCQLQALDFPKTQNSSDPLPHKSLSDWGWEWLMNQDFVSTISWSVRILSQEKSYPSSICTTKRSFCISQLINGCRRHTVIYNHGTILLLNTYTCPPVY